MIMHRNISKISLSIFWCSLISLSVVAADIRDFADKISLTPASFVYDGTSKEPVVTIAGVAESGYSVSYVNNVNAGFAGVIINGVGDFTGSVSASFRINAREVEMPQLASSFVFTGVERNAVLQPGDSSYYHLSGTVTAIESGVYKVSATLVDTNNFMWANMTTSPLSFSWEIEPGVEPFALDTRITRVVPRGSVETFTHSVSDWGAISPQDSSTITYTIDGGENKVLGSYTDLLEAKWSPTETGRYVFTHMPGGETAVFLVSYEPTITVESVRQQYPFNKVNVQYLIDDLDPSATYSVALKPVVDGVTNAVNIADLPATEGSHKVTFDAANAEVAPGLQNLKKKIKLVGELYAE